MLAPDAASLLLAQANAYKRHVIKARDGASYGAERDRVAAHPRVAETDVAAVFAVQLAG